MFSAVPRGRGEVAEARGCGLSYIATGDANRQPDPYNFVMRSDILFCSGEFRAHASEREYRSEHLLEFVLQAQMCFRCAAILNFLFLFSDWRFYGQTHFYYAVSARGVIELASMFGLVALAEADTLRRVDWVCIAWAGFVIPASTVLISPKTDIALLVSFILPPIFYLALPVSFRWSLIFGVSCSAAALGVRLYPGPLSQASIGLATGMLMNNTVFVLVLSRSNRLRRLEWTAYRAAGQANEELAKHRDTLRKIIQAVPAPLMITSKDSGKLIQANEAACDYFGTDLLKGSLKIEDYISRRDWAKLAQKLRADGQAEGIEIELHFPNGVARDALAATKTVAIAGTEAVLTVLIDITRRKEYEAIMEKLANTDPLSGLPNRARFFAVAEEEIGRAQRYKRPLAVFMVDIDHFKRINDTYGHDVGDSALRAFADLCRGWVRHQDIVARLGGEEFGILLPETDEANSFGLAERLRAAVENLRIEGLAASIAISIGISEIRPGETTVDAALSRADQALYAAKRSGRNRTVSFHGVEVHSECASSL